MRIDGFWLVCDDGVVRPVFQAEVQKADGSWQTAPFLVDTGADRTVLSAMVLACLGLPSTSTAALGGVGGTATTVEVQTVVRLREASGALVAFKGRFAAFTDPAALDMSVVGRDLLNLFAVLVDRPRDFVCLLSPPQGYNLV